MSKNDKLLVLCALFIGIIIGWKFLNFNNISISKDSKPSTGKLIQGYSIESNCDKKMIKKLIDEILILKKLNHALINMQKKHPVENNTKDDTSYNIDSNMDKTDMELKRENDFIENLYKVNWEYKPDELAKIILNAQKEDVFFASLVISQKGFNADEDKINELNIAYSNIYTETNNDELKYNIVEYLSNIEPDLFETIYSDFPIELSTAIDDHLKKQTVK